MCETERFSQQAARDRQASASKAAQRPPLDKTDEASSDGWPRQRSCIQMSETRANIDEA